MTPRRPAADAPFRRIVDVAADLGCSEGDLVVHGPHRAELRLPEAAAPTGPIGSYVLVTATTPTRAGEGKTVTAIGLAMGLARAGRRATATLRQSSLGPTLGLKGGGAGGGRASLVPISEALLGLGADLFAVESANNLLAAEIDDRLAFAGAGPPLDPGTIWWRRVLDMDDRALRSVIVHPDGSDTGPGRPTGFDITAASEVMAVLSLATDLADLRARLSRIVVGFDSLGAPVTAEQLDAAGAMAVLLRDALRPNLLQTTEGTPALVHGGPFANIAHGCSSIVADRLALERSDYVVTEAGFGADLGAEKLFHLKHGAGGPAPDAVVLVTTVRALADHGARLGESGPPLAQVAAGATNLDRHVTNLVSFGAPVVVAINRFGDEPTDAHRIIDETARSAGAVDVVAHTAFTDGGAGCGELAEAVERASTMPSSVRRLYEPGTEIPESVETIATRLYGATGVRWSEPARRHLARLADAGFGRLPVCMAKTHLSLSHDPALAGAPSGYELPIRDVRLQAGAGFVTVYAGDVMTMPGLPRRPRFVDLDLGPDGNIIGLA